MAPVIYSTALATAISVIGIGRYLDVLERGSSSSSEELGETPEDGS